MADLKTILRNLYDFAAARLEEEYPFELSWPAWEQEGRGWVVRAFVLGGNSTYSRPFAWVEADAASGEALAFHYCADQDFIEGIDLDAPVDRELAEPMDVMDYLPARAALSEAFEMAFANRDTAPIQAEFRRLTPPGLWKYYRALGPVCYGWLAEDETMMDGMSGSSCGRGHGCMGSAWCPGSRG